MKKITITVISVCTIFLLNTCALEIANVLGPDGGYVFYDKGSYTFGWRYIQCSPFDFGELRGDISNTAQKQEIITEALRRCSDNSADWHKFGWELPTEADIRKMLECFSYGLTRFSPDYYYLSVNNLYAAERHWTCQNPVCGLNGNGIRNTGNYCTNCAQEAPASNVWVTDTDAPPNPELLTESTLWNVKIFHKDFSQELNGTIEQVPSSGTQPIRVRAIRRF
ncbi:MAG: hypothetical protein FWC01_05295 [Treponema sp.]|nr:hypothetical protein [Treponema sp.]MCL2237437.1 hypothetical protein [Treponema sp.]